MASARLSVHPTPRATYPMLAWVAHSGRTNTPSEGNFPLSIYRPRNRPHERISHPETMSISDDYPIEQEVYAIQPRHHKSEIFTPRLRQDRRSQARLSAWKAPSFDDTLGTLFFSRQNRQILLFVFGFIFPFGKLPWPCAMHGIFVLSHTD